MCQPSPEPIDEASPDTIDILRDILADVGTLPRLMEICYLVQEPGLLDVMRGLGTLSDKDRQKLKAFLTQRQSASLHLRDLRADAVCLEWSDKPRVEKSA